jgi:hypothetical protein
MVPMQLMNRSTAAPRVNRVFDLPNELLLIISSFLPSRPERWRFAAAYPELGVLSDDPMWSKLNLEYGSGTDSAKEDDLDSILGILYEDIRVLPKSVPSPSVSIRN